VTSWRTRGAARRARLPAEYLHWTSGSPGGGELGYEDEEEEVVEAGEAEAEGAVECAE